VAWRPCELFATGTEDKYVAKVSVKNQHFQHQSAGDPRKPVTRNLYRVLRFVRFDLFSILYV
jgi:hypothetical protein